MNDIAILIPVFNDWISVARVAAELSEVLDAEGLRASLFLVDDGSTEPFPREPIAESDAFTSIHVVRLRTNLGHQRAICVGLAYLEAEHSFDRVVVMDGDGEDSPSDVPRLLAECTESDGTSVVFAERTRRSEGFLFAVGYAFYRFLHRVLTGSGIRVGNFSVVPRARLCSLVAVPDLWNHYAAAVMVSRQPYRSIPTLRAKRMAGRPSMTYTSLVVHGLSAISVYSDRVGVRLLAGAAGIFALTITALGVVVGVRVFTDLAVPGWATYTAGLLIVVGIQTVTFALMFIFSVLSGRRGAAVLPCRDYGLFIQEIVDRESPRGEPDRRGRST